jgi:phage/conjugal plasmid C-4 type zinc finger TraR family protein
MDDADRANIVQERAMAQARFAVKPTRGRVLGRCEDCGDDIEPARLKVFPYAVRCLGCQTEWERRDARLNPLR